jgi:hypothetical protein
MLLFFKHPASPAKVVFWCVLLHYDSSKRCTCPLNKCIYAFKFVKLYLKHPVRTLFDLNNFIETGHKRKWRMNEKLMYVLFSGAVNDLTARICWSTSIESCRSCGYSCLSEINSEYVHKSHFDYTVSVAKIKYHQPHPYDNVCSHRSLEYNLQPPPFTSPHTHTHIFIL